MARIAGRIGCICLLLLPAGLVLSPYLLLVVLTAGTAAVAITLDGLDELGISMNCRTGLTESDLVGAFRGVEFSDGLTLTLKRDHTFEETIVREDGEERRATGSWSATMSPRRPDVHLSSRPFLRSLTQWSTLRLRNCWGEVYLGMPRMGDRDVKLVKQK